MSDSLQAQIEQLLQAIAGQESLRPTLGDAVVDASLAALREKLAALEAEAHTAPAEQRKQVTVLFADVSGFTALSETIDAEEVLETINALWQRLDGVITEHGGSIDKHIGDAVMALFGAPVAHEDDPEQAIRAALRMQAELARFRPAAAGAADWPPLQVRIGINTGPVLLGAVGTTDEYTAIGDAVNVASRLEHIAPPRRHSHLP
jgi:adenylate cyclase